MDISYSNDLFEHIFGDQSEQPPFSTKGFPTDYFKKLLSIQRYDLKKKESVFEKQLDFFGSIDFFVDSILDAVNEGRIHVTDGEKVYICNKSIYYKNSNFMFFYEENSPAFILLPSFFSGSAIFDVREKVLIVIHGGHRHLSNQFLNFFQYIFDQADKALNYLSKDSSFFSGLLAANARPYHFFYDILPAVELIAHALTDSEDKAKLVTNPKKIFFDIDELYSDVFDIEFFENDFEYLNFKDSFYVDLAVNKNFVINNDAFREFLDRKVYSVACTYSSIRTSDDQNDYDLNLWFGITSQKRIWLNQVESIVSLLNSLSPHFTKIRVFIDGWTSCVHLSELDKRCIKQDNEVFEKISSYLHVNVKAVNLIGYSSQDKIRLGSMVDAFIVNHSAGSLHISRFCKKVGVSHLNTVMQDDNQIHYNTIRVPDRYIINKKNKRSVEQGAVALDYYVDFKAVCDRFIDLLTVKGFISTVSSEVCKNEASKIYNSMSGVGLTNALRNSEREPLAKPDLLRESALVMEEYCDINTAYTLMKKAHELRPNGPLIKKKLNEYSFLLLKSKDGL
ncbi:hypothetical protein [Vreelandella alkaliphila]|uniref:hypothetical protein n=1 Tax=Vreelandella alkaliphila TaxID=272774 RepID=UPI00232B5DDE|nr:hypothetical protein [Halomonas alkaliphila]